MDLHHSGNYMIRTMCGGESPYKSEQQQQLIDQGLIPNPLYHSQHPSGHHRMPVSERLCPSQQGAMPRPLIAAAGAVSPYSPLTNGSVVISGGRSKNGLTCHRQIAPSLEDNSAVNAVRHLIGDNTQQGVDTPEIRYVVSASKGSKTSRTGVRKEEYPLQLAVNNMPSGDTNARADAREIDASTEKNDNEDEPRSMHIETLQMDGNGCQGPIPRQPYARRSSTESAGVIRSVSNGNFVGNRPTVKRCASDESEDEANKRDLKRSLSGMGKICEPRKFPGERRSSADLEECVIVTERQPKKRGRRKKCEVLAAQLQEASRAAEMGGPQSAEDVRRVGRDKKPYDPWADRKASGQPFVQDGPCFALLDVTSKKFPKCSSCRLNDEVNECRFSEFRKLRFVGELVQVDGFTDSDDAHDSDRRIWMTTDLDPTEQLHSNLITEGNERTNTAAPFPSSAINRLDEKTAIMVLTNVGDIMCDLVRDEAQTRNEYIGWMSSETDEKEEAVKVKWRRVYGVREMCDVCSTTIFNLHWTCGQCGFVACIDCFRTRAGRGDSQQDDANSTDGPNSNGVSGHQMNSAARRGRDQLYPDKDEFRWLYCGNPKSQRSHCPRKLLMTQIVPDDILERVNRQQHDVRRRKGIPMRCGCGETQLAVQSNGEKASGTKPALRLAAVSRLKKLMAPASNGIALKRLLAAEMERAMGRKPSRDSVISNNAIVAQPHSRSMFPSIRSGGDLTDLRVLADIATQRSSYGPDVKVESSMMSKNSGNSNNSSTDTLEKGFSRIHRIASAVLETRLGPDQHRPVPRLPVSVHRLESLAPRVGQKAEGRRMYDAPHEWLCDGKLLLLLEATHPQNLELFQEQWNRGQPVVVAHVSEVLDMNLWRPDAFLRDFGEQKSTLVDCKTGADLGKPIPMKRFWEGFECFAKRMCDKNGDDMLLKLKDWPPDENFSEVLPDRYADLMRALPLPMYTLREGSLNLANRLPACFVPPDLGPKMYNAYGSALFPTKGTTNLHLDMSDAANVMVYVGIPRDGNCQDHIEKALLAVEEAGCDATQMKRVREKGAKVGAVWHIFHAQDAEKIRELLKEVMVERGQRIEAHSDPIHDQLWYLDSELRRRLLQEKGVRGYAIAQCVGDAVFIPAGAPHQVRNLHSCIKVAEDFVSPENLAHCLRLTNEFRFLSDTHTNHEDKLQIKNVVYHAVKDAVSVLDEGDRPCAESC